MRKIVIVDYGMGNLHSIQRAFHFMGETARISSVREEIRGADYLILPGVGAFEKAMEELTARGLVESVLDFVASGRPLMGICLGMQLLFTESHEFGLHKGLDLVKGSVVRFHHSEGETDSFKIPQIGWNSIHRPSEAGAAWNTTILDGIDEGSCFYFVHSFVCRPEDRKYVLAETSYGRDVFCSVVRKDNIWGCQFHPEKSGDKGLHIYKNFLTLA